MNDLRTIRFQRARGGSRRSMWHRARPAGMNHDHLRTLCGRYVLVWKVEEPTSGVDPTEYRCESCRASEEGGAGR